MNKKSYITHSNGTIAISPGFIVGKEDQVKGSSDSFPTGQLPL